MQKNLETKLLGYFIAESTLKVPLTFNMVEKTKHENFDFISVTLRISFFISFHSISFHSVKLRISFQLSMDLKTDRNKACRDEKRKKTTRPLHMYTADVGYSLLAFFHFCLDSVPFSGPSLTETKFYTNCFPSF